MMKEIEMEALRRISHIAWEECTDAELVLQRIQGVLYELEMMQDARSIRDEAVADGFSPEVLQEG